MGNFYKRYIYKNGVKHGPYYYSNKKVDGKVISTYLGTSPPTSKEFKKPSKINTKLYLIILLSAIIVTILVYLSFNSVFGNLFQKGSFSTGNQIQVEPTGIIGSNIGGEINVSFNKTNPNPESNQIKISVKTIQHDAVVNEPVKWTKEIKLDKPGKAIVNLPPYAKNIIVYKIQDGKQEKIPDSSIKITAKASAELNLDTEQSGIVKFFKRIISFLTGKVVNVAAKQNFQEVTIDENTNEYSIEYETPAPLVREEETGKGKQIKILTPADESYSNILTSTELSEALNVKNPENVKIYWVEKGEYINPEKIEDKNSNGIYDYLEFIAPLSNQTFEIIVITKAEHLDSNKTLISNIYDQVKEQDNIWSEEIKDQEYVRVTFEKKLTSINDVTIFPRIISGSPRIEIYEKDKDEKIAEFSSINSNEYNQVLLTNLQEEQDTFDLKIVGGSVFFDYIVDPFASPSPPIGGSLLRSQQCLMENSSLTSFAYNLNCQGVYPGVCGSATDRIGCNDGVYVEQLINTTNNRYTGMFTSVSNSSITDCASINQVFFCYEWWRSGSGTISNCVVQVDANGGASYTSISTTCPGTSSNPTMICVDVTSLEPWSCGVFFGSSATGALARNQIFKTSGNQNRYLRTDTFYFNVSYTKSNQPPTISFVQQPLSDSPLEAGVRNVVFEVRVTDLDGAADIDKTSVTADFSKTGETTRSGSCVWQSDLITGLTSVYSCIVGMQYYDAAGTWTMTIKAKDLSGTQATDSSGTFTYQSLKALVITSPVGSLAWPTLNPGASNVLSNNDPNIISNTGNYEGPVLITAKDLIGASNPSYTIPASNFRAGPTSGLECTATQLQNNFLVSVAGSNLPRGSGATTSIYYCITSVPLVSSQAYSATGANAWVIEI
ncbi:hypothetical protein HY212_05895 [Candidatus Pacearchaeota archaeon]|nr:hypothetical protein [Candidatus Pacearchaeota archaeon]